MPLVESLSPYLTQVIWTHWHIGRAHSQRRRKEAGHRQPPPCFCVLPKDIQDFAKATTLSELFLVTHLTLSTCLNKTTRQEPKDKEFFGKLDQLLSRFAVGGAQEQTITPQLEQPKQNFPLL